MTTLSLSLSTLQPDEQVAAAVSEGLLSQPKWLPSWLFYDAAGSRLFDQITSLPEYYPTRTERAIFAEFAEDIIGIAADCDALHIVELGAGSCDKTRILLRAAVDRQDTVVYEPVDVSATALVEAQQRIEQEISGVLVCPRVMDYTRGFSLDLPLFGHRRLVLYIGSSIGNFEPQEAAELLHNVRASLNPGDAILLGVDQVKDVGMLLDAYDDAAGVTAEFNRNVLVRLNRELGANFDPAAFAHLAVWNSAKSRIEMHLQSRILQMVQIPALDLNLRFGRGETIHTENSYKYRPGQTEAMLSDCGFAPLHTWKDEKGWFAVSLARAV
jgi:dimethylhistidine N-methyltransferase